MSGFGKNGIGFGGASGGGSASDVIYKGASPTTITVGGEPVGTNIYGKTLQQIIQEMLCPFVIPTFASFSNSVSSPQEVGTTLTGNKTFYYSFNNPANIQDGSIAIIDNNTSTTLASGLTIANGTGVSVNIGTITNNSSTYRTWKCTANDTLTNPVSPITYTILWYWRLWYGTSSNATLNEAQIKALSSSALLASITGSYNFAASNYKYFVWDDSLGSPTAVTGFKDSSTGLQVAMASVSDDPFYSNVQNGWYYGLVSVTQNGVTSNKRVYRTLNQLGGSITIIVS